LIPGPGPGNPPSVYLLAAVVVLLELLALLSFPVGAVVVVVVVLEGPLCRVIRCDCGGCGC
jgi:hypothetical protein